MYFMYLSSFQGWLQCHPTCFTQHRFLQSTPLCCCPPTACIHPFPPCVWDSVMKFVFTAQNLPSPYSQCLSKCGLSGLTPNPVQPHLSPFSHTCLFPLSFPTIREHTETHANFHTGFYLSPCMYPVCAWFDSK